MAEFILEVEVTLNGYVEVQAETPEAAEAAFGPEHITQDFYNSASITDWDGTCIETHQ